MWVGVERLGGRGGGFPETNFYKARGNRRIKGFLIKSLKTIKMHEFLILLISKGSLQFSLSLLSGRLMEDVFETVGTMEEAASELGACGAKAVQEFETEGMEGVAVAKVGLLRS